MNKIDREIVQTGLYNMQLTLDKLYNNGVVEGVRVVENLIEQNNITDMNILKEALKIFVRQYEEKDNTESVEGQAQSEGEVREPESKDDQIEEASNQERNKTIKEYPKMGKMIDADELKNTVEYMCDEDGSEEAHKWCEWFTRVIQAQENRKDKCKKDDNLLESLDSATHDDNQIEETSNE